MRKSQLLMPLGGVLAGLILASGDATSAEVEYPHDTVTLVTHSSPGGGTDVFLREMIKHLGPIMGVDFVVENASGGSGAKAMALLATSPPDGTIFYGTTPTFINTSILSDVDYTYEDLEPLVNVFLDPQIVYTRGDSPFNSLAEVIEAAKADPGAQTLGREHARLARPAGHGAAEGADRGRRDHRHPRGRRRPADQRAERHPRRRGRGDPGAGRPDRGGRGQAPRQLHRGAPRHPPGPA